MDLYACEYTIYLLNTFFNIVEYKKEDEQKGDRLLDKVDAKT